MPTAQLTPATWSRALWRVVDTLPLGPITEVEFAAWIVALSRDVVQRGDRVGPRGAEDARPEHALPERWGGW